VAAQRLTAAKERTKAARETAARVKAGSRKEEIDAARARLAMVDAQIATQEKALKDAIVTAPVGGIVTEKLVNAASWSRRARRWSSSPISITRGAKCSWTSRWCRGSRSASPPRSTPTRAARALPAP
jgi:hypothetical protein